MACRLAIKLREEYVSSAAGLSSCSCLPQQGGCWDAQCPTAGHLLVPQLQRLAPNAVQDAEEAALQATMATFKDRADLCRGRVARCRSGHWCSRNSNCQQWPPLPMSIQLKAVTALDRVPVAQNDELSQSLLLDYTWPQAFRLCRTVAFAAAVARYPTLHLQQRCNAATTPLQSA